MNDTRGDINEDIGVAIDTGNCSSQIPEGVSAEDLLFTFHKQLIFAEFSEDHLEHNQKVLVLQNAMQKCVPVMIGPSTPRRDHECMYSQCCQLTDSF